MRVKYKGCHKTYDSPAEPPVYEDDFGNEVYGDEPLVKFNDGTIVSKDTFAGMTALQFIDKYIEYIDCVRQRAKYNSLYDFCDKKIKKRNVYYIINGYIYSHKTLKETTLDQIIDEVAMHYSVSDWLDEEYERYQSYLANNYDLYD